MTVRSRPRGWAPLAALALTAALAGCGRVPHSAQPAAPVGTTAGTTVGSTSGTVSPSAPATSVAGAGADAADLNQVEADEQGAGGAADQSDADFDGGVAAQAENDTP